MRKLAYLLCGSFLLGLIGCSPIHVRTDYDREVDFSFYKTFKWMPIPKKKRQRMVKPGSLLDVRIRRAVERELEAKGYVVKKSGPADALLAYHVGVQDRIDVTRYGYGYWGRRVHVHRYKEGSIIIDIVDAQEKQLIWRGAAQGVVGHPGQDPEKIDEAMAKVFEKYPPGRSG